MAIEIDFGRELGRLAFPDDVTDEQAQSYVRENYQAIRQGLISRRQEELAAETEAEEAAKFRAGEYGLAETIGGTISELPRALLEGFGGGLKGFERSKRLGAEAAQTGIGQYSWQAVPPPPGAMPPQVPIEEAPLYKAGEAIQQSQEVFPSLPGVRESIPAQIAGGVGSTLSVVPAGVVGGPASAAAWYAATSGESTLEEANKILNRRIAEALASGQNDLAKDLQDKRSAIQAKAFGIGALVGGGSELTLGLAGKLAGRVRGGRIGGIGERLAESLVPQAPSFQRRFLGVTGAERVRGLVEGLATEGAQESLEQLGGNIGAAAVYDPERGWLDGVAQAGFIGAASGGLIGGAVGSRRNADLGNAAAESLGANPSNPLPRSSATVAGIQDGPQPTGPIEIEPDVTPEEVLKRSQELGIPVPPEMVTPATAAQTPASAPTPTSVTPVPAPEPATAAIAPTQAAAVAQPTVGVRKISEFGADNENREYQIDAGGQRAGQANLARNEDGTWKVEMVVVDTPGMGIGPMAYEQIHSQLEAEGSGLTSGSTGSLSKSAIRMWEKLVSTGKAEKTGQTYRMKPTSRTAVVTPTAAPVDTETGLTTDEQAELDALIEKEDAGTLTEDDSITLSAYRSRLGFPAQPPTPTPSAVQEQGPDEGVLRREEPQPPVQVELREVDQGGRPAEVGGAEAEVTPEEVQQVKAEVVPETPVPAPTPAPAPEYTPARINKLFQTLKARATAVGKGLYEIKKLAPGQRAVLRTRFGGLQETDQFLLREKSQVTGNPSDEGYILRDKQEYMVGEPPRPAPKPAPAPASAPAEPTLQYTDEDFAAAPSREAAGNMAVTQVRTNPSLPPRPPQIFYTLEAVANRAAKRPYDPKNLTAELIKQAQDSGLLTAAKNPKLTADGQRSLADGQRQSQERKAAQANLSDALRERAVLAWDAANDPQSAAYRERIAAKPALAPAVKPTPTPAPTPQADPNEKLATFIEDVDGAITNLESPAKLRAMVKKAVNAGYITARDAAEIASVQKSMGSAEDTTDAFGEFAGYLNMELEKRRKAPAAAPVTAPAAPAPAKKAAKDPATMTASEINKELDRLDAESSAVTQELIDAGRGSELTSETLKKTDPLSLRALANFDRRSDLRREISARYGPNAPSRLPAGQKGFGPRKAAPSPAPVSKVDQAIAKLENLKVDTGGTFDAVLGIPALVWNGALITAQNALRAGRAVTQAIDAAIEYIRTNLNEKQAAKVNLEAVRNQFETDLVLGRSASEIVDDGKLSGYKQKARHLIPEERRKLRSDTKKRFVDLFNKLPSVSEFTAAALGGAVKRGWYRKSAEALIDVFGVDAPRFAALLAGLSPQTSVESNLINALNVWKNWNLAGRPTDRAAIVSVMGRSVQGTKGEESVLDAWINNSVRALSSEDPTSVTLSGPKVNSFMLNLRGVVNEVTNDAWMANFALVDQAMFSGSLNAAGTDPGKGTGYLAMSAKVRATAEYLTELTGEQWTPAEVQETVWSWAKTLYELQDRRGETRNALEILRAGELTEEAIAGTPDFATLLADGEYRRILAEAGYGNQVEQLARRSAELRGAGQARSASQAAAAASQTLRNAEERAARRLVQLRKQRAAEAEAERNQRPDRVEALLQKVIAATDPRGKAFEAITALSSVVIYQATKIALRIYQATKSWVAARNAGMDYIKSHVQLQNEPETAANFEEFLKAVPNQEIPAGTPELPQPPSPAERVESRGLFVGDIERDTDENWASEAKKWVDFFNGNLERAYQVVLTADIDNAFKEYILGEIIQRNQLDIARAKNDVEVLRALNLEKRLADSKKSLGAITAKAMAARNLSNERFWWAQPAMILRNLIRKRQDELIPFSKIESEQVRKWLTESGREAVNQIREAMKKADNVFAREFRKIKQVPGEPDGPPIEIKWQDILTQALDTQGSVRQKMLQVILADPRLRNLSPAGIAEITNLLTKAWEAKRNQIFRAEFQKKVPLPNVKPDIREKLLRSIPRILKYANIARATPGSFSIQDGPDTFLLWEQAFRDAVAPEFGVAELNGATARKITDLAQKAQAQSGVNRNEIIQQMFRLMAREGGVRFSDVLRDYWYAAVLSGIRTQVDNAMNVFNGFLNTAMFATMAKKDAGFIAYSALKGLNEAVRDFWPMLWHGELYRSVNFNPDQPGSALEGLGQSRNLFAKGISQFKYVGRLINALDHMTALMSDSTAKAYALRKLYGPELARQYLTPSPEVVAAARARAIAEGTRPELVNKRTREIIQEKLPVEILLTAKEIREMTTFTETPQGLLGSLYRGLDQAAQGKTLYKVLSGTNFLRFAANSANEILNFAFPVAFIRYYQSAPGRSEGEYGLKFSESRRDLLLAKAAFGTALGIFAGALFLGDDDKEEDRNIDITGSFKSLDPNKRKQLLAEGRQPYSIRFGNTYVSYRQLGFGGVLATIGELRDRQLFSPDKWSQENIVEKILDGAAAGMFIIKDSTAISGLTELLGFANAYKYDTDEFIEKSFPRYVSRLAGSLVPNILKEVDAWSDPSIFKTEAGNLGYEYFLQQVPFGRREIGPGPILNVLGEPVKVERYPWSRWAKEREDDLAWGTLGKLASRGVFMPTPAITVKVNENGTRRELTREEKYQYQQAVGQGYRKFIEQNSKRLLALPPAEAADFIDKNADRIRRNARTNLKNSF